MHAMLSHFIKDITTVRNVRFSQRNNYFHVI